MTRNEKFNIFIIDGKKKILYDKIVPKKLYYKLLKLIISYDTEDKK